MDPLSTAAASGLRARMESLDMLANNMANANTAGFKADREYFTTYMSGAATDAHGEDDPLTAKLPDIDRHWTDFSAGTMQTTGKPLDFALTGKGFFVLDDPNGPLYTRNGNFSVSSKGQLVSTEGYPVRGVKGNLTATGNTPVEVTPDGTVRQSGSVIGQFQVAMFQDPSTLVKQGYTNFASTDPKIKPTTATDAQVKQGTLEAANTGSAESAVRLVSVMRQFEMLQKAVSLAGDMNKKAIEEVARVSS